MRRQDICAALLLTFVAANSSRTEADVVLITTRKHVDTNYGIDRSEMKGPGMTSPGDAAISILLGHHGYSSRLIIDSLLASENPLNERTSLLEPADPNFKIGLIIMSGSSSSADVPEPPTGIPVMMGEHVTLGNNASRPGSLYIYNGTLSSDPNDAQGASKFMKVLRPDHPIMAGIPLDGQGRVKIFRDPYPQEDSKVPAGGFRNYEYRWCTQNTEDAAPGTLVLGVLDSDETRACLAVVEAGEPLANGLDASARLVHIFVNENGSNGSRRVFLALTDIGQTLFLRAAQWAMGETLAPHRAIGVATIETTDPGRVQLSWDGSASHNYKILASPDLTFWQTAVEDIAGVDGPLSHSLSRRPDLKQAFFRIIPTPGLMP